MLPDYRTAVVANNAEKSEKSERKGTEWKVGGINKSLYNMAQQSDQIKSERCKRHLPIFIDLLFQSVDGITRGKMKIEQSSRRRLVIKRSCRAGRVSCSGLKWKE